MSEGTEFSDEVEGFFRRFRRKHELLVDFIWPSICPQSPKEIEEEKQSRIESSANAEKRIRSLKGQMETEVDRILLEIRALCAKEDDRRQSVESRLSTVLALMPVLTAFTVGGVTWVGSSAVLPFVVIAAGVPLFILAICQLVGALLASVKGLARRGYPVLDFEDLIPDLCDTTGERKLSLMLAMSKVLIDSRELNSRKVDCMALAHTFLRNFVFYVALFAVVALFGIPSFYRNNGFEVDKICSNIGIVEIRQNPNIFHRSSGPDGPAGPGVEPCTFMFCNHESNNCPMQSDSH